MEIVNVIEGGFEVGGIVAVSVVLLFFVILAFVGIYARGHHYGL